MNDLQIVEVKFKKKRFYQFLKRVVDFFWCIGRAYFIILANDYISNFN